MDKQFKEGEIVRHRDLGFEYKLYKVSTPNYSSRLGVDAAYIVVGDGDPNKGWDSKGMTGFFPYEDYDVITPRPTDLVRKDGEIVEFKVKVRVRQDDIDAGCHNARGCAVNRAAIRAIQRRFRRWDIRNIGTSHDSTDFAQRLPDDILGRKFRCLHSTEVRSWISSFDNLDKVEPFETEMTFTLAHGYV